MTNNENIIINRLPAKTWYWLDVNETKLPWDRSNTVELESQTVTAAKAEKHAPVRIHVNTVDEYSNKNIRLEAMTGGELTVFMDYGTRYILRSIQRLLHMRIRLCVLYRHSIPKRMPYYITR